MSYTEIVVGLDGYRDRWLAVLLRDAAFAEARVFATLREAVEALSDAKIVAVDIPIGLPGQGPRPADEEARGFVGDQYRSVFPAPIQAAVAAASYQEALAVSQERTKKGLSRQSYGLREKILETAAVAREDSRVYEVHPEVSFCALAGAPLSDSKRSWAGSILRRRLLTGAGIILPDDLGPEVGEAPTDDVLDAAVAAWSAHRIAIGTRKRFPSESARDEAGDRFNAIWY